MKNNTKKIYSDWTWEIFYMSEDEAIWRGMRSVKRDDWLGFSKEIK